MATTYQGAISLQKGDHAIAPTEIRIASRNGKDNTQPKKNPEFPETLRSLDSIRRPIYHRIKFGI